jgi:hypothetical protein
MQWPIPLQSITPTLIGPELGRLRVKPRSVANGEIATHLDGWLKNATLIGR